MEDCGFGACREASLLSVGIDDILDGEPLGRLFHRFLRDPIPFSGFASMILQADELLNRFCFPQAFYQKRHFSKKPIPMRTPQQVAKDPPQMVYDTFSFYRLKGEKFTVFIRVICRQNATWQGELVDGVTNEKRLFRSALELMWLLQELSGRYAPLSPKELSALRTRA